jgi:hypothetical protein
MIGAIVCFCGFVLLCLYLMARAAYVLTVALLSLDLERRNRR